MSPTARTTASRSSTRTANSSRRWSQFGRPSGIYIDKNDMLYSADSESRDGRTNIGRGGMAPTGYGFNLGAERGIRIGSVKDGKVKYFIPDALPLSL